jgi:CBS domain containing-hemolysin-like protein
LKTLVDASQEDGVLEQDERRMIYSVFELRDTLAREIMVPRIDVLALDVSTSLADAVDMLLQSGYSRLPIFEETVDNILGLLYAKDLLRAWRERSLSASGGSSGSSGSGGTLRDLLRPAYFVPEAKKVDALLAEMQSQRIHMAVVVDEYGGVAGLVTLEDIIEEILGEIQDEYDQGEEAPYQLLKDGTYEFLGRIDLDDLTKSWAVSFSLANRIARAVISTAFWGMYRRWANRYTGSLLLTVRQVSARRIRKVRARYSAEDMAKEKDSDKTKNRC